MAKDSLPGVKTDLALTDTAPTSSLEYTVAANVLDPNEPHCMLGYLPPAIRTLVEHAVWEKPEWFNVDEVVLKKTLGIRPTATENRIRLAFWQEYERVVHDGLNHMNLSRVAAGICSKEYLHKEYFKRYERVAWTLCPPSSYMVIATEALSFATEKMREILELDVVEVDAKGRQRINTSLANLQRQIWLTLDQRVKGAVVQKQLNVNVDAGPGAVKRAIQSESMEEIEKRIRELERKDRHKHTPYGRAEYGKMKDADEDVIEVTPSKPVRDE